jgi:hypothetical protein
MKILFYELFVYSPFFPLNKNSILVTQNGQGPSLFKAYIQRRGSLLAWSVILSVHGADTIAEVIDLSLSALISWFMKSNIGF